ncbi:MAG: glycosyltransferase family 4 protein [Acidobacteriota bacterium]|nr:glycosyltransferase family 4 protein [Acidobacteriota bacterium]
MLSPEAPYPPHGGGSLRTASLLGYLARRYAVDLIVFREPQAADPLLALPPGLVRNIHVIELRHHAKTTAARAIRNGVRLLRRVPPLVDRFSGFEAQVAAAARGKRYEVAIAEHFWCAPYIDQLATASPKTVLDLHNIESVLHAGCAATEPRLAALGHRHFYTASRALETALFPRYSQLLAASAEDARRVREISPSANVSIYPNALPWCPVPSRAPEFAIAFSGNLEYHPNQTAVRFFAGEIWPSLRERWPGLVWRLIGKNPEAVHRYTRSDSRIQRSGPIPDAIAELAAASVVVAPLLTGSGTRLKILEAWAAARPVVSTRIGAEGLPAKHGENILLADSAPEFIQAVSELLGNSEMRRRLGKAARLEFERNFTWEAAWSGLQL